jgi:hypothetical protein
VSSGAVADVSYGIGDGTTYISSGSVSIVVLDPDTGNPVCTTDLPIPYTTVSVTSGATTAVTLPYTVDPSLCTQAAMEGDIGLHNVPGGVNPSYAYVYSGGSPNLYQQVTGFSASTPDRPYLFTALKKATYSPYVYMYFPAPYSGEYLFLPNYDPHTVDLTQGGTARRDFLFDGGVVSGNVALSGPAASYYYSGYRYYNGRYEYDSTTKTYGPTYGGYAGSSIALDGDYDVILTEGTWLESQTYFYFQRNLSGQYYQSNLRIDQSESVDINSGAVTAATPESVSVSEGVIVFDVIEPPGSSTIGIDNPRVYANRYDSTTGTSYNIDAYTYITNAATPGVRLIGPPGDYSVSAYATVSNT